MNIEDAIVGRQSIRAFLADKPVPRDIIEKVLEIAGRAPSGSNIQPWKVYVITGERKAALTKACLARHDAGEQPKREYNYYPVNWRAPYIDRRRECGWGLYQTLGIEKGDKARMHHQHGRNYEFFDAPVGVFFTLERDMEIGSWLDTGMFIQSVMIAARAFGLETCPQAAFCNFFDTVMDHIGAPAEEMLVCGMSLGYPEPEAVANTFRTTRLPVSAFTTFVGD
jgi:nitroreductase